MAWLRAESSKEVAAARKRAPRSQAELLSPPLKACWKKGENQEGVDDAEEVLRGCSCSNQSLWGPGRCFQSKANHLEASRGHSAGSREVAEAPRTALLSAGERLCILASGEHPPRNRFQLEGGGGRAEDPSQ